MGRKINGDLGQNNGRVGVFDAIEVFPDHGYHEAETPTKSPGNYKGYAKDVADDSPSPTPFLRKIDSSA